MSVHKRQTTVNKYVPIQMEDSAVPVTQTTRHTTTHVKLVSSLTYFQMISIFRIFISLLSCIIAQVYYG